MIMDRPNQRIKTAPLTIDATARGSRSLPPNPASVDRRACHKDLRFVDGSGFVINCRQTALVEAELSNPFPFYSLSKPAHLVYFVAGRFHESLKYGSSCDGLSN